MNTPNARAASARQLITLLVFAALAALILSPLYRVFSPAALLTAGALGALTGSGIAYFATTRRWGGLSTVSFGLFAAYLAGLGLRIFGALTVQEPVGGGLITETAAGIVRVWKDMLTLEPRFGLDSPMVLAPFLIAFIVALSAGAIALRVPRASRATWAAAIPLVGYGLATLLGWRTAFVDGRLSILIAAILLTWAAWWSGSFQPRRVFSIGVTFAVLGSAGVFVAPVLLEDTPRFVLRDELAPPFDPRDFPSPLSGYRTYIKELKDTDLFTISGLPAGTPIRLATMDDFDGVVWNVSGAHDADGSGAFRRIGDQLHPNARGVQQEVEIEIHEMPGPWLPTVGWLEEFHFDANTVREQRSELRYNDATGTALLPPGITAGTRYELTAIVPRPPQDEDLLSTNIGSVSLPEPTNVPEAIITAASDASREASSPIGIARALEQYLQDEGWFSNGQTAAGDYPSLAGHGASRLISLLTSDLMVGNDEQYASAMALMGRSAGLPARVVMGFIPDYDSEVDEAEILDDVTVQGGDIHAWVEVQFASVGWVPFFPTPPESKTPAEDLPQDTQESQPQIVQPPLPPPDEVTPPDEDTERPQTEDTTEDETGAGNYLLWIAVGGGIGLIMLLWLVPILVIAWLKQRRRNKRRKQRHPVDRVTGGWDELVDVTFDINGSSQIARSKVTRAEFAADIATLTATLVDTPHAPVLQQEVLNLAYGADAAVFSPAPPGPREADAYWQDVDRLTGELRRKTQPKRRRKARWTTVSLKYRRKERRAVRKEQRK